MNSCLIGISGGVDSLFAAKLLKEQGFDVTGVHLHLHSKEKLETKVLEIFRKENINIYYADYTNEFKKSVIDYFIDAYLKGYTPNPCVVCNKEVKLTALFEEAEHLGADYIATGHYADIDENGFILRHKSPKDQSYFLACVDKKILKKTIFPLRNHSKEEIKDFYGNGFLESSDLCFVKNNYRELLEKEIGKKIGNIIKNNEVVGYHQGFYNYTIGQRKGIKVGSAPHYVTAIDAENNIVYADEEGKLYTDEFYLDTLSIFIDKRFIEETILECQVRYNAEPKQCRVDMKNKKVKLFDKERAITPGQIAVFYYDDRIVGCGEIGYGIH